MKKISPVALAVFVLIFVFMTNVQAQSPQEILNQYIADLQKNPNNYALREKIIKFVQEMKPAPAIPEEARRHYVMALTLFKGARKIEDYGESIEEFKSALLVAPWWAEANRDLGMALEAAKRYDEAINALKLYMASVPAEEKARAAQDEIYKIEGMKKLAARERKESSPQVVAAREQNQFEDWLKKIDGRRYTYTTTDMQGYKVTAVIDVRGTTLVLGAIWHGNPHMPSGYKENDDRVEIRGRETIVPFTKPHPDFLRSWLVERTFLVSEDGDRIIIRGRYSNGDHDEQIYLWQR
jgi:hypothetical protein